MSIFPTRILLATDSSREAELAAATAADLAERTNSELHLITVGSDLPLYELPDYPARFKDLLRENRRETKELLEEQVKRVQESGGTVNETHLREGSADEEIVELAEEIGAGMIVMGSRGHGRIRRALMGSVSDSVVRHAHCPVLVVRTDPIVFPAKMLVATDGSKREFDNRANTTWTPQFHCERPPNRGPKHCSDDLRSDFWDLSTLCKTPSKSVFGKVQPFSPAFPE